MFLLLFIIFNFLTSGLLLLDFILGNDNLDRLLLSALVEEHVARCAVRVAQAAEIGALVGLLLVTKGACFELLELPIADSAIIVLHPWVSLSLDPFSVTWLLICASIGVDVGPVVASISSTGMHVDTDKLILITVILIRFTCLFLSLAFGCKLLLGHLFLIILLVLLLIAETGLFNLLLFLKTILLAHDLMEGVRLKVEDVGEFTERVDLIILEGVEVEADTLQVDDKDVRSGSDHGPLLEVDRPVATTAIVVVNNLTFDHFGERLLYRLDALDRDRQVQVIFHAVLDLAAFLTHHLTALLAAKDSVDQVFARGVLQGIL